jgi:ABC-type antimicrobial peptide transport system permease subunit
MVREGPHAIDPTLPVFGVTTLEKVVASSVDRERYLLTLLTIAAFAAMMLASVGIFGVLFYSTSRRAREIGIRMALGAHRLTVVAMVLRTGMRPVLLGMVLGLFASVWLARAMTTFLFEVSPDDPLTFVGVIVLVLTVSLAACVVPARWATRIEAASALRTE